MRKNFLSRGIRRMNVGLLEKLGVASTVLRRRRPKNYLTHIL